MSTSSFQLLCDLLDKGEMSPRQAFVTAGIRVTEHEPFLISVFDVLSVFGGIKNRSSAWESLRKTRVISRMDVMTYQFPGSRQRNTPVVNIANMCMLVMNMKGQSATAFRVKYAAVMASNLKNVRASPEPMGAGVHNAHTNTSGYVYMAHHPGHSDVKIGMTTKDEKGLRKQYSRPGMAHALYTEFEFFGPCQNVHLAESSVHRELAHYRHSKGREWFVAEDKEVFEHFRNVIRSAVSRMDHDGHVKVGCKRPRDDEADQRVSGSDTPESARFVDESRMLEAPSPPASPQLPTMDAAEKYRMCMVDAGLWDDDAKCVYRKAMDKALLANS